MGTTKVKLKKHVAPAIVVPVGVYLNHNRHSAVMVRQDHNGVWFLTMMDGTIEVRHLSVERFLHEFSVFLEFYPVNRALRIYRDSTFERDDRVPQIIKTMLRGTA
jgi:hypothetical protein